MSLLTDLYTRVVELTNRINAIGANSKVTEEMPLMNPVDRSALIRLSKNGTSYKATLNDLIDEIEIQDGVVQIGVIEIIDHLGGKALRIAELPNPKWRINGLVYTKTSETIIPIPFASTDKHRIDIFVGNEFSEIQRIEGVEDDNVGIPPAIPENTVEITRINIFGETIENPELPSEVGYITKSSKKYRGVVLNDIPPKTLLLSTEYTTFDVKNGAGSGEINGFISFVSPLGTGIHDGLDIYIRNNSEPNITLLHDDSNVLIPFYFSDEQDLSIGFNQIAHLKYNQSLERVELVNVMGETFNPTNYDLDEFQNASLDPFVRESEIPDPTPPFIPADHDLDEFQNESADPFVRASDVPTPELLEAGKNIRISDNKIAVDIPPILQNVSTIFGTTGIAPNGIAIDSEGNIYTANLNSNNVTKITPNGVSSIFGTTGNSPTAIVIDSFGNIYTANWDSNNVSKITPDGVSTILASTGTAPNGIVIDSVGNIYTSNLNSNNVSKITPDGISIILGETGNRPYGIAIDSDGNVYTPNRESNNVTKITPDGVSTVLGTTGIAPNGIAIDSDGNIYTANSVESNVTKITPDGISSIFGTTGIIPTGIVVDSVGNIYAANRDSNNVTKITPNGVSTILETTGTAPNGIVIDSDGNVYTSNYSSNNVTKITVDSRRNLAVDDDGKIIRTNITDDFEPSEHDLDEFNNESADPFVRESEIPSSGIQTVTGDGVSGTPEDVVLTFPTASEIGAQEQFTTDESLYLDPITSELRLNVSDTKQRFVYDVGDPQEFTLLEEPTYVDVFVNGVNLDWLTQYTIDVTNKKITILDELNDNDLVLIKYQYIITI